MRLRTAWKLLPALLPVSLLTALLAIGPASQPMATNYVAYASEAPTHAAHIAPIDGTAVALIWDDRPSDPADEAVAIVGATDAGPVLWNTRTDELQTLAADVDRVDFFAEPQLWFTRPDGSQAYWDVLADAVTEAPDGRRYLWGDCGQNRLVHHYMFIEDGALYFDGYYSGVLPINLPVSDDLAVVGFRVRADGRWYEIDHYYAAHPRPIEAPPHDNVDLLSVDGHHLWRASWSGSGRWYTYVTWPHNVIAEVPPDSAYWWDHIVSVDYQPVLYGHTGGADPKAWSCNVESGETTLLAHLPRNAAVVDRMVRYPYGEPLREYVLLDDFTLLVSE